MKRSLTTREKVMVGLLAGAAIVAYRLLSGDGIGFGAPAEKAEPLREFGEPPVVRMDLLRAEGASFDVRGRNLFAYYVPPPPPRKAVKRPPPPPTQAVKRPPPPPPPPPVASKPKAPLPTFSYLGFLGPKEERIAVFDAGEGVRLARIGDVVEKDYRLLEFKHDGVKLGYTDARWGGRTTELPFAGLQ